MIATIDVRTCVRRALERRGEPGAAVLGDAVRTLLDGSAGPLRGVRLQRLSDGVYRLRLDTDERPGSVIVKRHEPATAQRNRLTIEQWLPVLGLGDCCAPLIVAAAEQRGRWVWHVYQDLGDETLAVRREAASVRAAIDLMADLHTRAAHHPILPEARRYARDYGVRFFLTSVSDAMDSLQTLDPAARALRAPGKRARARLLERLHAFMEDAPLRAQALADIGGPDTLLHGDLWPQNVFVQPGGTGPRVRLIDWDRLGVGPASYDVSTVLYRAPVEERAWIIERYRQAVEARGWTLPTNDELNLLFHTAETARYASCIPWPVIALNEGADWGAPHLVEIERWFDELRFPLLGDGRHSR